MATSIPKLFLTVPAQLFTLRALDVLTVHAEKLPRRNLVAAMWTQAHKVVVLVVGIPVE
jgi:hypothetical protein